MDARGVVTAIDPVSGLPPLAVSFKEACRLLGIGSTHMAKLINESQVETLSLGRRRLITYASLKRLVNRAAPGKAVDLRIKQKREMRDSEVRVGA
jgi:excisionase family DNA binding protein